MTHRNANFSIFLLVSFGITVPLFYCSTIQGSPALLPVILLVGSYAPALGAWIASSRDGVAAKLEFRQRLWGWGGGRWVGMALAVPTVIWFLVYGFSNIQKNAVPPAWTVLAALPVILLFNYGEEIGWRGYALPYLMKRFSPFSASLVLGVVWALFHAALYWQRPVFGLMASGIILLMSVILAWTFVNTQKILPGTILHASFNAWTNVFINQKNESLLIVVLLLEALLVGYIFIRYGRELAVPS